MGAAAGVGSVLAELFVVGVGAAAAIAGSDDSGEPSTACHDTDALPAASHSGPSNSDSDDDHEKVGDCFEDRPRLDKPIFIPKNRMKDLLNAAGKEMYDKLKGVILDDQRTIWSNRDFRMDAGYTVHNRPNFKTWNLQVNQNPQSHAAKELVKKFGTHEKLIWDTIDPKNPPDYRTWAEGVLKLFSE
ncbi:hypothetical protein BDQ94DRAFT_139377 [Aspergillus welwitschiae]|uniref:Uncharacterized protein n=1 Tax=Aspergillus welwitschiae TaxID=1341132 RepID=A0A3F3QAQ1_9EURO|nr:hypothetical protein BDQ94DRAFT_139377 [Aspergillus welwitschiae]RDH35872.1 hypothetical protein BDQ94DRAFT_139377 [Aspergillus welwitschiae]